MISFSCYGNLIFGQELKGDDALENLLKIGSSDVSFGVVRKFDNRYSGVQGSPFFFDYWSEGTLVTSDGRQIENIRIKYNAHEDELITKNKSGQFYLPKTMVKSFTLIERASGTGIRFSKHRHPKNAHEYQFYRIIHLGAIDLLEHIKVIFEKANFEGGYSNDKPYDEFKKYPVIYYIGRQTTTPRKLKTTVNGVSKIFPEHENEIKEFITTNRLDCKNERDLIRIVNFYESPE